MLSQAGQRLSRLVAGLRAWGNQHRRPILVLAVCAFVAGLVLSVIELDLPLSDIDYGLLLLICLVTPASVILNANELQLCARFARVRLGLSDAAGITTAATVANLLPLPAGLIIRGGALVNGGASLLQAGGILVAAGLMWIALALSATAFALAERHAAWLIPAVVGLAVTALIAVWIARRSTAGLALGFVAVRLALLALLALRLWLAFAAIGAAVPFIETIYYSAAGVAGTVVMIVPAGLGVSEGLGAAMAAATGSSAAAAFLALGLNRVLGLAISGIVAALLWRRAARQTPAEISKCV